MSTSNTCIDAADVLDLLSSLVERSLLAFDDATGRYSMLETVRQYSREKLVDSGEGEDVRQKHVNYVRAFVDALPAPETLEDSLRMISLINRDIDNVRAAIEHSISIGRSAEAGWILQRLQMYWIWTGKTDEARSYYRSLLTPYKTEEQEFDRAGAEALLSHCSLYRFDVHSENALPDLDRALREWTKLGDPEKMSECHRLAGNILLAAGRVDEAEQRYLQAASLLPDGKRDGVILNNLGLVEIVRKNWARARALLEEALEVATSRRLMLATHANMSRVALMQGRLDETREWLLKLFEWHSETLSPFGIMPTLERVAEYVSALGRFADGATCLGAAQRWRDEYRYSRPMYEEEDFCRVRSGCLSALGGEEFERRYAIGRAMSLRDAATFAQSAMAE